MKKLAKILSILVLAIGLTLLFRCAYFGVLLLNSEIPGLGRLIIMLTFLIGLAFIIARKKPKILAILLAILGFFPLRFPGLRFSGPIIAFIIISIGFISFLVFCLLEKKQFDG